MSRLPGVESPEQVVCHVDVDCFYAACERLREPVLEGEPVVVGMGYEPGETHGAVATASYEAREHGVESAMAISEALERLSRREADDPADPSGFYRPVDMAFYEAVSGDVRAVLSTAAETVRNVSIDEAYLDLGNVEWAAARSFGRSLKREIEADAGVVASVGIAPDMTTAKLASDAEKPDGLVVVDPDSVRSFLGPIPVEELHGVGPVTASELRSMGFETAGDIASGPESVFVDAFGERGRDLYAQARGEDDRVVEPKGDPKSLSSESAFTDATEAPERKKAKVRDLASEVTTRASGKNALYRTIGIKVVTPPFDVNTRSCSLSGPVDDPELVERTALELLSEFADEPVRKLGVRLSNLSFDDREQATISEWDSHDDGGDSGLDRRRGVEGGQVTLSRFE
ncbi:DNA-directed DNA polymerase Y [Natronomonas moolapensis 8.8.11]|uniref:DNA polymerase IV n=1 Tax=Natronomonas moolapensis (strain DSM 18674 / CECT 7526 / JCM 14361 / 8.8.11) TaxID=268739 RepID=M1XSQ2_NATM8|nr:DNA-directed DNA polymerase Y [Natronomonas moolapensis 8.8.11]